MNTNLPYREWFQQGLDTTLGVGVFFEHIIEALYGAVLSEGDTAIDCGANRGRHTFPMSRCVGASGRVVAVEAIASLSAALQDRLDAEQVRNVSIVAQAVGERIGRTTFHHVRELDGWSGIARRKDIPPWAASSVTAVEVPVTTLDALTAQQAAPAARFIKMDLEGGEYHALLGASELLAGPAAPLVVFENGRAVSAELYGYTAEQWFALFARCDYSTFDLFGRPFTIERWREDGVPWYFVAARRPLDIDLIERRLPGLIESVHRRVPDLIKAAGTAA